MFPGAAVLVTSFQGVRVVLPRYVLLQRKQRGEKEKEVHGWERVYYRFPAPWADANLFVRICSGAKRSINSLQALNDGIFSAGISML